jgi:hypothetical protein
VTTEHDPTIAPATQEPIDALPLALHVERDGTGSASFDWEPVLEVLTGGLEQLVRSALGRETCVVGVRFIDSDGRAVDGPVPAGITLVGFTTTQ